MDKSKKLIAGVIGVLSIVATTSMATPAFAATGADLGGISKVQTMNQYTGKSTSTTTQATQNYINKNTSSKVTVTSGAVQQQLSEGWNALNNSPDQICYTKSGVKQTGWVQDGGWRYFDKSTGFMVREKWIQDGGAWYYLKADGVMASGMNVDGYHVNTSGAWDSNAISGAPTYRMLLIYKTPDAGSSAMDITRQDFVAKVASGQLKATVTHYSAVGGSSSGVGTGFLQFYLAD